MPTNGIVIVDQTIKKETRTEYRWVICTFLTPTKAEIGVSCL